MAIMKKIALLALAATVASPVSAFAFSPRATTAKSTASTAGNSIKTFNAAPQYSVK